mmetsp:Transcript_19290/g.42210  ORF Transcript_19290/g.42210 Transcript_19290/m.42210 type:complete len:200 (-) Transcript_19290:293-892(-)
MWFFAFFPTNFPFFVITTSLVPSRLCQSLRRSFAGRLPIYLPSISRSAFAKSNGSRKLTKPYPFVLLERLSRTTLAFAKEVYLTNALVRTSSFTSFPRSPTKRRWSFSGHSSSVLSTHFSPAAPRQCFFCFFSSGCPSTGCPRSARFTPASASASTPCCGSALYIGFCGRGMCGPADSCIWLIGGGASAGGGPGYCCCP